MEWTVRYFKYQSSLWDMLLLEANAAGRQLSAGPVAYALRKGALYRHMARRADRAFVEANLQYSSVLT